MISTAQACSTLCIIPIPSLLDLHPAPNTVRNLCKWPKGPRKAESGCLSEAGSTGHTRGFFSHKKVLEMGMSSVEGRPRGEARRKGCLTEGLV